MTSKLKKVYVNRLKSFFWRTTGLSIITASGFIGIAGSIYLVDWRLLADIIILQTIGAMANEVTKYLNTKE